jgi:small subunit ribosomal protein S13
MVCTNFLYRFVSRHDKFGPFMVRFFGIGLKYSRVLCKSAGLRYNQRIAPTPLYKVFQLERIIKRTFPREFARRREVNSNLFFKYSSGSIAGQRLSQGLPSRRQRSKTNGQTAKRLKIDFAKLS